MAKHGIKDFAEGTARAIIIPKHLGHMRDLSQDQHEREEAIVRDMELVRARSQELEHSSSLFLAGEEAYQRLLQAKKLDSRVDIGRSTRAKESSTLQLSEAMHDSYLREIVETGGAPSLQELATKAEALGGHGNSEESMVKKAVNSMMELFNDKVEEQNRVEKRLEMEPRREAMMNVKSHISKGQLA